MSFGSEFSSLASEAWQCGSGWLSRIGRSIVPNAKPVALENESITLEVPSKFYYEWIDSHYGSMLLKKLKELTGENVKIRYSVVVGKTKVNSNIVNTIK